MRLTTSLLLIAVLLCALLVFNFQKTPVASKLTIDQLMEEAIEKRVQKYIAIRDKKCNEKILAAAASQADSLIIAKAKFLRILSDTIDRPLPPDRPNLPELLPPIDSSFPVPILEEGALDSQVVDSIFRLPDSLIRQ